MATCVLCRTDLRVHSPYRYKTDAFRAVYTPGLLYECVDCGLKQVDCAAIDADALMEYYRDIYRTATGIAGDNRSGVYLPRAEALLKLATQSLDREPARVFEVGAGHGHNLSAFGRAFPEAELLTDEIDQSVDLPDRIGHARLEDGRMDVVILSHVLEHFEDPVALIRSAEAALSPGGVVVIEVPNETADALVIQPHHEPHLTFFEVATMRSLLADVGDSQDVFTVGAPIDRPGQGAAMVRRIRKKVRRLTRLGSSPALDDLSIHVPNGRYLRGVVRK